MILSISCRSKKINTIDTNNTIVIDMNETINIKTDTINIIPLGQKEYKLKQGDILCYTSDEYPSMGKTFEYELVWDDAVIDKVISKGITILEYSGKKRGESNTKMSGGGKNSLTLFFKAKDKGNVKLIIMDLFRDKVESTKEFKITVE